MSEFVSKMSIRQRRKLREETYVDADRVANSASFQAMMLDVAAFGRNAFLKEE
jgi:hypothetical protein